MKIRAKIFLAFGVLIGIMAISSGISVVSFSTTSDLFHDYEAVGNLATAAQEVERELAELDQHVEQYAATGDLAQHDKVLETRKARRRRLSTPRRSPPTTRKRRRSPPSPLPSSTSSRDSRRPR